MSHLIESWGIIMHKKEIALYFLVTFTIVAVILSAKYSLTKPLYASSSLIKIGKQPKPGKNLNDITLAYIESPQNLVIKLNSLYEGLISAENVAGTGMLRLTAYGDEPVAPYELVKSVNESIIKSHQSHYDESMLAITQAIKETSASIQLSENSLNNRSNKISGAAGNAELMSTLVSLKLKLNYLISTIDVQPTKILRKPVKSNKPLGPNLKKYILIGVIGGGGMSLFAAFIGLYIRDKKIYLLEQK